MITFDIEKESLEDAALSCTNIKQFDYWFVYAEMFFDTIASPNSVSTALVQKHDKIVKSWKYTWKKFDSNLCIKIY